MAVGIRDVAARAGVSIGTVSNVLNRPTVVAGSTRIRVETAINELGFVRNDAARTLRSGSRTVAMLVSDDANPFFTDMARGARRVVDSIGGVIALYSSDRDAGRESRYLQVIEEQRVLGLLFDGFTDDLSALRRRGTPAILIDRGGVDKSMCSVSIDHRSAGSMVAQHLLSLGHRNFAYIGGTVPMPQLTERHEGFQDTISRSGLAAPFVFWTEAADEATIAAIALKISQKPGRVTGVFCANDLIAVALMQAFTQLGVEVPKDVSVVGYDDIAIAHAPQYALTTVRQPREELGARAAELLLDEAANDDHVHDRVLMNATLIQRGSTGAVRAG